MPQERAFGIIAAIVVLLTVKAGCVAMSIVLNSFAPTFTARALHAYQTRGLRCFALGAANGLILFFLFAVAVNAKVKVLGMFGALILLGTVAAVLTGYMIAYHDVGRRLRGDRDWPASRMLLLGGITAEVAFLAPVLGQVFSIGVLFRGFGAVISALLSRGADGGGTGDRGEGTEGA